MKQEDSDFILNLFLAWGTKPGVFIIIFIFIFKFPPAFTGLFLCVSDVWSETMTSVLFFELIFNSFLNINCGQSCFYKGELLC